MKTEQKQAYLAPQIEMLVIELEEGIAAASPSANPSSNGWETGGGGSWNGDAS